MLSVRRVHLKDDRQSPTLQAFERRDLFVRGPILIYTLLSFSALPIDCLLVSCILCIVFLQEQTGNLLTRQRFLVLFSFSPLISGSAHRFVITVIRILVVNIDILSLFWVLSKLFDPAPKSYPSAALSFLRYHVPLKYISYNIYYNLCKITFSSKATFIIVCKTCYWKIYTRCSLSLAFNCTPLWMRPLNILSDVC